MINSVDHTGKQKHGYIVQSLHIFPLKITQMRVRCCYHVANNSLKWFTSALSRVEGNQLYQGELRALPHPLISSFSKVVGGWGGIQHETGILTMLSSSWLVSVVQYLF